MNKDTSVKVGEISLIEYKSGNKEYFIVDSVGEYVHGQIVNEYGIMLDDRPFLMREYLPRKTISREEMIEQIKTYSEVRTKALLNDLINFMDGLQ